MHSTRRTFAVLAIAATLLAASAASGPAARAGDAPRAIDAIENDLVADDPAVRAKAAAELTDRFPDGAVAVPMLVDLLDDEDAGVVAAAAKAIDSMAVAGAGPLTAWCADKSRMGPKSPFAGTIAAGNGAMVSAADFLWPDKASTTGMPEASAVAAAPFTDLRNEGAQRQVLGAFAALVRRATPDLRGVVAAVPTSLAADVLVERKLGPYDNPARTAQVATAVALLGSKGDLRTLVGARMLARLRPSDAATATALAAVCVAGAEYRTPARELSDSALRALIAMGPSASPAAPRLVPFLQAKEVSLDLVWALVTMGKADDVEAALARHPADAHGIAIGLTGSPRSAKVALPILIESMAKDPFDAHWIGDFGAAGAPALPALRGRLDKAENPADASHFADAILAIDPHDADAIKYLEVAASHESDDPEPAAKACDVLLRHGVLSPVVVARVVSDLAYTSDKKKMFAVHERVRGVGRCGAAAKPFVEDLVKIGLAADQDLASVKPPKYRYIDLRHPVAVALGSIGPDANSATALLDGWKTKGDETIRVAAAQALRRIRAKR